MILISAFGVVKDVFCPSMKTVAPEGVDVTYMEPLSVGFRTPVVEPSCVTVTVTLAGIVMVNVMVRYPVFEIVTVWVPTAIADMA